MADRALVSAFAPAKINLYLHVVGRREDGYHLLDMLIAFAGAGDRITVAPAGDLTLRGDGHFATGVPGGEDNLILKAARGLAALAGRPPEAAIHLEKNLPPASGIGGGSADAAATLRALEELWGLSIPRSELRGLALSLGADVPVCLHGRASFSSGIGEVLNAAPPLPETWLVLVNPGVPVSTPAVFTARRAGFSDPAPFDTPPADAAHLARLLAERSNDLEIPARALAPEVGTVLEALRRSEDILLARMSGSGATCFGLFGTEKTARTAARNIASAYPGWWVNHSRLLENAE